MKYAIGISLNLLGAKSVLLREDGKVVSESYRRRKDPTVNNGIELLIEVVEDAVRRGEKYRKDILGVGFALGGIVDQKKGIVYWPQPQDSYYAYISVPVKKYFQERISYPIILENDANASAYAEYILNYSDKKYLIYMFSGVGCGIIINGALYHGKCGAAGELFLNHHKINMTSLGGFSFLHQWPITLGIEKLAKEKIAKGEETVLIKKITSTGELASDDIIKEAYNRDKVAAQILKEVGFSLGIKIAFLINLLNPEVVVIGGGLEKWGELFLEEVHKGVKKFSFYEAKRGITLALSSLGEKAASLGVAHIVLRENSLH